MSEYSRLHAAPNYFEPHSIDQPQAGGASASQNGLLTLVNAEGERRARNSPAVQLFKGGGMKRKVLFAAALMGVTFCPMAHAGKPVPPGGDSTDFVLRFAAECTNTYVCIAEYTVPQGYMAVVETVSMYARDVIRDAEVQIIGGATVSFRLPFTNPYSASGTSATTYSGKITAVAGELIRLQVHMGTNSTYLSVAASGYLAPSTITLAP